MPGFGAPGIELEHLHRYAIAAAMVEGNVLDLGCGVGYGSSLLAPRVSRVVCLDISLPAVSLALRGGRGDTSTGAVADACDLPFPAGHFDWVVCLEVIEHVAQPAALIAEISRVLAPHGRLLLSTPNRPVYSGSHGANNPFHRHELDEAELRGLLAGPFRDIVILGQQIVAASATMRLGSASSSIGSCELAACTSDRLRVEAAPTYFLACCGRSVERPASGALQSVLAANLEPFLAEREETCRQLELALRQTYEAEVGRLTGYLRDFDARIRCLGSDIESRQSSHDLAIGALRARLHELEDEHERHQQNSDRRGRLAAALARSRRRARSRAAWLEQHGNQLRERLDELGLQHYQLHEQHDQLHQQHDELRLQHDQLHQQHDELRLQHDELRHQHDELRHQHDEVGQQRDELRQRLDRIRHDYLACYGDWQQRRAELASIHGSKMWRFWTTYHSARRGLLALPALAGKTWSLACSLVSAVASGTRQLAGWVLLLATTARLWLGAWCRQHARLAPADGGAEKPIDAGSGRRPRVLMVCPYHLYPANHGGGTRMLNLARHLSAYCDVHLLVFARGEEEAVQRPVLESFAKTVHFHAWEPRLWPDPWGLVPNGAQLFASDAVKSLINEILAREGIDILQLEYTELGQYGLPRFARVKVSLSELDITFRTRQRRWRAGFHQRYHQDVLHGHSLRSWMQILRFEVQVLRRADQVHVMSDEDRRYLARFLPAGGRKLRVVPNAVDLEQFRPGKENERDRRQLLFLGSFGHIPNIDAVDWLLADIWPVVRARVPDATLLIVGEQADHILARHAPTAGVSILGGVPDPAPYYQRCRAFLAPIRAGSGTRLKILEALACCTAVLSTALGAEGIGGTSGEHYLIADTPADLADSICRLLEDDSLCARLGRAGRRLIEARYTWQQSAEVAVSGYRALMASSATSPSTSRPAEPARSLARRRRRRPAVDISIIIPTRNGGPALQNCLAAVKSQRVGRRFEVICVDSGSPAIELEGMRQRGVHLVTLAPEQFDHGLARDLGAEHSSGTMLVFINQDTLPIGDEWLERLTSGLFADDNVAAAQGRIVELPVEGARFFWHSAGSRFYFTRETRRWLEGYFGIGFSTVNAALSREAWEAIPFGPAAILEDKKWQREATSAGFGILQAPAAAVYHTHNYSLRALMRRCYSEGVGWRAIGERYAAADLFADLWQPELLAELLRGIAQREVRSSAEILFPLVRPLALFAGNSWGRAVHL